MSNTPIQDDIRGYALAQVDAAYIMGATAARCTPKYRRSLAEGRSSDYADKILENCPVLSGKQNSCEGWELSPALLELMETEESFMISTILDNTDMIVSLRVASAVTI